MKIGLAGVFALITVIASVAVMRPSAAGPPGPTVGVADNAATSRTSSVLQYGSARDAGVDPAALNSAIDLFRASVARGEIAGAVVLVARNGVVVAHEAMGLRDVEARRRMEKNTMFVMASNSKPVTAAATAILVDRGKLAFDDPVSKFIPSFDNYRGGFILIKHLLSHTSGMRIKGMFLDPMLGPTSAHPDEPTLQSEVARFGAIGATVVPGTSYSYSNAGYNTLGALVEIASGASFDEFLQKEIFRPLSMADTFADRVRPGWTGGFNSMYVPDEPARNRPALGGKYDRLSRLYLIKDAPKLVYYGVTPFARGSGGVVSTAWDYGAFFQMLINGGSYGSARILKPETVAEMTRPHTCIGSASVDLKTDYGYGLVIDPADGTFSHGGNGATLSWGNAHTGLLAVALTNTPGYSTAISDQFWERVKSAVERPGGSSAESPRRCK